MSMFATQRFLVRLMVPELMNLTVETSAEDEDVEIVTATFSDGYEATVTDEQLAYLLYFRERFIGRHRSYQSVEDVFACPHNSVFISHADPDVMHVYILIESDLNGTYLLDVINNAPLKETSVGNILSAQGLMRVF